MTGQDDDTCEHEESFMRSHNQGGSGIITEARDEDSFELSTTQLPRSGNGKKHPINASNEGPLYASLCKFVKKSPKPCCIS